MQDIIDQSSPSKPWRKWLLLFAVFTLIALLNFLRFVTSELAEGEPGRLQFYLIMETTGAYTVLLLLPFLLWFFRKFPLTREKLLIRLPVYVLASMAFGACHTSLMFASRTLIYWLAGLGRYDYGHWSYRLLMEYSHQFFAFWSTWGIVLLVQYVREHQRQKLRAAELEQRLARARLQALQMQLNPHFLFNTLNLISSTMYEDVKAADRMIASLSDLLRKTLDGANWQEHPLKKELELLNLYVDIMKARFHEKLAVHLNIDQETMWAQVPGFILQPLVENSIRYGMASLANAEVKIQSQRENGRIILMVTDNGPGLPAAPEDALRSGVGLSNTAERLEKLYGREHRFQLRNLEGGGLEVEIEIPYRLEVARWPENSHSI